ncbi:uncharacterized protein LOC121737725 [Aricia agestis]|uniref:uncharacterized protein LOC121737725 n=1 Tax=Aricia agestis TaxID=91739 RepID=UPI001C207840|nr:uncharacterized protein LOC121737725 [Aricia agestis]
MVKVAYDPPTERFPYRIRRRFNVLSEPKRVEDTESLPDVTEAGVRRSALRYQGSDRVNDVALPKIRKLIILRKMYKNRFSPERLEKIDRMIEAANATIYTKLANAVIDLKNQGMDDRRRGWTESDWRKHMEYINLIARPKEPPSPPPVMRGPRKSLKDLLPRIARMSRMPDFKEYRRLSQESWYRAPGKVSEAALKYNISERTKKLAVPRVVNTHF